MPAVSSSTLPHDIDLTRPDAALLRKHLMRCNSSSGHWFSLRCAAESVHAFLAPRFVTTLVLAVSVMLSLAIAA